MILLYLIVGVSPSIFGRW